MTITAEAGPLVVFGSDPNQASESNPEEATSLFFAGTGLLDPRPYYGYSPGQNFGAVTAGWTTNNAIVGVAGIPYTATVNLIAAAGHTTAGTALTLASASADGVSVGNTIVRADTGASVTGLLQLDPAVMSGTANITAGSNVITFTAIGAAGGHCYNRIILGMKLADSTHSTYIPSGTTIIGFGTGAGGVGTYYMSANATTTSTGDTVTGSMASFPLAQPVGQTWGGQSGTIRLFSPQCLISRAVSITSTTSQVSGATFTIRGYDVFAYPMTEVITMSGASATTTNGKKAFKFIASVTPNTTDGTGNYSVGTLDILGFPLRSDQFVGGLGVDVSITVNTAIITSGTGYTAAVATTPTATTGDVRGTYALQTASDGTKPSQFLHFPTTGMLSSATGLYGQTQYADF